MAKEFKRYLVTSALPYANGPVHIGHLAGVYIPSDIYTRYLRRRGRDVLSICGSDEHGVAITIKARKEGVSPKEIIDRYHNLIKRSFERLGMSFDIYSRTSSPVHAQTASDFFRKLYAEGKFVEKTSEQYYDEEAQQFLADRYIVGTCPHCQNEKAYGDQCEKCGSTLSPDELIAPHSALSGSPLVKRETKHWYLPLDKYEGFLREWILEGHKEWRPNVYGQCKSWLDSGIAAACREPRSGLGHPRSGRGGRGQGALRVVRRADRLYIRHEGADARLGALLEGLRNQDGALHRQGQHRLPLHRLPGRCSKRMASTSCPRTCRPTSSSISKATRSPRRATGLSGCTNTSTSSRERRTCCATCCAPMRPNRRTTTSRGRISRRATTMNWWPCWATSSTARWCSHRNTTAARFPHAVASPIRPRDAAELQAVKATLEQNIENYRFREALKEAMNVARIGNKYLADCEPWKLVKTDPERVKTILNIALQITANLSIVVEPFMPFTAAKLLAMLRLEPLDWERIGATDLVAAGHRIGTPELLFEKIEDDVIQAQLDKLAATKRQIWRQSRLKILILRKIVYRSMISNAWIYVF